MGVRRVSGAPDAGSSSSHAVGAPVNTPSRARDGAAHPPSSGMSSLSRRVRLLPQSAGVTAEHSRPAGCGNGLRRRPRSTRRIIQRGIGVAPRRIVVRHGGPGRGRSACPSYLRGGRASPSHHDKQLRRDVGREHPACRRPIRNGWWHTPVRGRPSGRPLV